MPSISTCLWFDHQAEEAAQFYTSIFKNSSIRQTSRYTESSAKASGQKAGSVMTVVFEIEGQKIMGLNGGPHFKLTPAFSFFVWCDTEGEIDSLWEKLSAGGAVRMGLDKYPWAPKYGFVADKFGVDWQLMLKSNAKKIAPAFLFVEQLFGRGAEAVQFYTSVFKDSQVEFTAQDESTKTISHCVFSLGNQTLVLMEGAGKHGFKFNEAFSLVVECEAQNEIDFYWSALTKGGAESQCGWLKDKFGISWQIVPAGLAQLMTHQDQSKAEKAMRAIMTMKKLDIEKIKASAF